MMELEVFYTVDGIEDSIIIEGESVEEIKDKTDLELEKRCGVYIYSNRLAN